MGPGVPELVLEVNGRTWSLDPSRSYTVGRDPQADVALDDARVSWRHATVGWDGRGWVIEDHGSTNGTFVQGQRVQRTELGPGAAVRLGNAADGPRLGLRGGAPEQSAPAARPFPAQAPPEESTGHRPAGAPPGAAAAAHSGPVPQAGPVHGGPQAGPGSGPRAAFRAAPPAGGAAAGAQPPARGAVPPQHRGTAGPGAGQADRNPTTFHQVALGRRMRIGRALENELVVSDLQVSRHHAEFHATPEGRFEIHDLGSHNGTYVNGQPLPKSGTALLGPNDIVGVGHSTFRLVEGRLEEFVDSGDISFSARRLTVTVDGGKQILKDVSFGVPEKSLIAVIGPSGSGKSTLLKALTGYRPADQGEVLYDNRDLYKQFAELRQRIGLVPQDDILHKELTVKRALRYAAKLRFPADTSEQERQERISEVLGELKLDVHKEKKVTSLSGGQRKRVSVALELLTKPSLIFLDEPTSGLDPGMDRDVMQLLRGLADDGRTVLVVTHSVAELALCDKLLVMAPGGSVAYFGPPEEALNFFGYQSWADVFSAFEEYRDYDWAGRWKGSQHYQLYVADSDISASQPVPTVQPAAQSARPRKPQGWFAQLWTLMRRYVAVIVSDKGFLALTVALPVVLGVVSVVIPAEWGLDAPEPPARFNSAAGMVLMILVVGICLSGAANSVRELIKERVIYERERATGLSRSAYLMSKVVVLGVVTALQGVIITAIGTSSRALPEDGLLLPPAAEICVAIIAIGLTSMVVGLLISSLVRTSEMTMPLLVMFAIVQLVFTGTLFQIFGRPGLEQLAWLMPSRWAVAASGATLDLGHLMPPWDDKKPGDLDPLWEHSSAQWFTDMGVLLGLGVVLLFVVARLLRRHEPEVMRK
ncbi:FHA domain-containing protein [Streptomyces sp. NPDC049954]|uniref:ABC transporter ATP-binding protein/permease n=1 Tax=Streptomyces sp. NPDC049954 TaxID=3155779 RepID=UPI0034179BB3